MIPKQMIKLWEIKLFLPQPGEIETNNDLYESSDEEYDNRLRLGSKNEIYGF